MLDITQHSVGDVDVLHLSGRLVLEGSEAALAGAVDRLVQQGRIRLVLDMRQVTYVDSAGLGLMVAKLVTLRRRGGDLRCVHLTERSERLMTITNLASVFGIFESVEEAVASFETP